MKILAQLNRLQLSWQRLRRNWGTTLIFSLISTLVCGILVDIIDLRNFFDKHNLLDSFYYTLASMFIYWSYAVIVLLILRLNFERAAELVQRPGRYCKLVLFASLLSSFIGTTARSQLEQHSFDPFQPATLSLCLCLFTSPDVGRLNGMVIPTVFAKNRG